MQTKDEKVDAMITKLLEVRGKKPGKNVTLAEDDIKHLCFKSREIFIGQPNLLELEAPIKICGKLQPFTSTNQLCHYKHGVLKARVLSERGLIRLT